MLFLSSQLAGTSDSFFMEVDAKGKERAVEWLTKWVCCCHTLFCKHPPSN